MDDGVLDAKDMDQQIRILTHVRDLKGLKHVWTGHSKYIQHITAATLMFMFYVTLFLGFTLQKLSQCYGHPIP